MSRIRPVINAQGAVLKKDIIDYYNSLNFDNNAKDCKIYISYRGISQDKLRDAGYSITRDPLKADIVLIRNYIKEIKNKHDEIYMWRPQRDRFDNIIDEVEDVLAKSPNAIFIYPDELYRNLYKYTGDLELYNSLNDLLSSYDKDNVKTAMEIMSNANWSENQIYLAQLFYDYNLSLHSNTYKNSISFKGFLESLGTDITNPQLYDPDNYRPYCITQEHHNWVYNKYKEEFESELNEFMTRYKMKIDKLEYSIDGSIYTEEREDSE